MANRTYTEQDVIEALAGDNLQINQMIATALNTGADVGCVIRREIARMESEQDEIELDAYIASGEAEQDRRQEAYEMQHDCY